MSDCRFRPARRASFAHRAHPGLASLAACLILFAGPAAARDDDPYFPPPGDGWARLEPREAGFDPDRLAAAIEFARANESREPRDLGLAIALTWAHEPYDAIIGPTRPRGEPTGLVIRHGRLVARWGDPDRVDMTFSVTKSFLSTVVGIAHDRGRIADLHARVAEHLPGPWFESEHNRPITWDQLLRQTSNWRGTLWGKPDWGDRPTGDDPLQWPTAPVPAPGTAWEYNDVRVNLLALAALHVWREPLPEVLRREVMEPIGASDSWQWHGYENSWVELDGRRVQSVSGGGHWGGGLFISAWDQARFGLLCLRRGRWGGRQIFSEAWYRYATTPTPQNPEYGVMNWFLNTGRKRLPAAPESAFVHLGAGANAIYVDPENDLVVVVRWIDPRQVAGFIAKVLEALDGSPRAAGNG